MEANGAKPTAHPMRIANVILHDVFTHSLQLKQLLRTRPVTCQFCKPGEAVACANGVLGAAFRGIEARG